ncbi:MULTISPECIES: hypothetical protein [unclassified Streptomyces]|uniref:hypothetical protein n=1 Tax=unclassified Streptomyces TaxID=2593676 RepID=UPI00369DD762
MKKMIRARAGLAAGVTVMALAGIAPVSSAAAPQAAQETTCTDTDTFWDSRQPGKKADVRLCVDTDGTNVTVRGSADCYSGWGMSRYDACRVSGSWRLLKGEDVVSEGDLGQSVLYAGPGTYTLVALVDARAFQSDGSGGTSNLDAGGTMTRTVSLTEPVADGPRLQGKLGRDPYAVTVTNNGNMPARSVVVELSGMGMNVEADVTSDSRCAVDRWGAMVCALGDLAPGATAVVALNEVKVDDMCLESDGFGAVYRAENFRETAVKLCS